MRSSEATLLAAGCFHPSLLAGVLALAATGHPGVEQL